MDLQFNKPTAAFIGVSWLALFAGVIAYFVGLWNAEMLLNEKGYYFILMLFGLFSAVSLQKVVRDKLENIAVTHIYYALCWASLLISMLLLAVGLWNANLLLSEKGFYAMSFILSLFGAVAVQKNIRDIEFFNQHTQQHLPSYTPSLSTPDLEASALEQDDTKSTHTP